MKSNGWGGKREGAGRKPGPNVRVSLLLSRELWATVQKKAENAEEDAETWLANWLTQHCYEAFAVEEKRS